MQIFGPTGSRSFPTDRNPTRISVGVNNSIAGGVNTVFATYICPVGRRAEIWTATGWLVVTTVLAAGQFAFIDVEHLVPGTQQVAHRETARAAALGTQLSVEPCTLFLVTNDTVNVRVTNTAGAGIVQGSGGIDGIEYDA